MTWPTRLVQVLLSVSMLVGASEVLAQAGSCRQGPSVCIDAADRVINGITVSRPCWEYRDTYECVDPGTMNTCVGLQSFPGCSPVDIRCDETAFNGACLLETKRYSCGGVYSGPTEGVVTLPPSYTVTSATLQLGTCANPAANPACTQTTPDVCIDGPGFKDIDGVPVFQECWEWERNYACSVSNVADYCQPLAGAGCAETGTPECIEFGPDGACNRFNRRYVCTDQPPVAGPEIVQLDTSYTITRNEFDATACDPLAGNPTCAVAETVCVQGPETRIINGLPVYRDCWELRRTFTCSNIGGVDYCAPLAAAGCTPGATTCVEFGADGQCNRQEVSYSCLNNPGLAGQNVVNLGSTYAIRSEIIDESLCSELQANNACAQPPNQVCTQGPETRVINGLPVYRDCWQWEYVYTCSSSDPADFCAPLRTLGCAEGASLCTEFGADGQCNSYTRTFTCLNHPAVEAPQVTNLGTSYTIRDDFLDLTACADPASNPACTVAAETCVEPGETRMINGLPVYRPCWRYERSYTCTVAGGANYCGPIAAEPGCTQAIATCVDYGVNGDCIATQATYRCDNQLGNPLPPNVTYLETAYTIVSESINNQCTEPETNPACSILTERCAEPGGTRIINGLPIYRPCWRWERTYICQDPGAAFSDCAEIQADPSCSLARTQCSIDRYTGVPDCGLTTRIFSCRVQEEVSNEVQTCYEQSCVGPMCGREPDAPDTDFAQVIANLEMQRQAGGYLDEQGRIFSGFPERCERRLFGLSNCCRERVQATQSNNASVFATAGMQFVGETIRNMGSAYVWDGLFGSAVNLYPEISGFAGGAISRGYAVQAAQPAQLSVYGITASVQTFANAGTFWESFSVNWSFDPTSFAIAVAIQVLTNMAACNQAEQSLALKKGQRLCTFVGSYRQGRIFRRSYEGYCCYNSRLARIVQEQGRQQLGRGYGSPQNPDCTGLTPEELEQIDFAQIDLSEFIAEVQSRAFDTTAAVNRLAVRGEQIAASDAVNRNTAIAQYMPGTPASTGATDRTPGAPGAPPAQTPRSESELRGCAAPTLIDEVTGACLHPSGDYYEPRTMIRMPCARGFVKDNLVNACVNPATGQYYPLNSDVPMPCPVGQYLEAGGRSCREPTDPG